jgi:protease II
VLSADGTAAIAATAFSKDGKYFSYGISLSGSDFFTVYVRKSSDPFRAVGDKSPEMDDGVLDTIRFVKFSSIVWTHDNKGFFYQVCEYCSGRYSVINLNTRSSGFQSGSIMETPNQMPQELKQTRI